MYKKYYNLARLIRINQPIGLFLLLWPTLWGLWIANKGTPNISIITLFIIEVICMRSAGCVINDYIDYNIDGYIQRTKNRPLIDGTIKKKEALIVFSILIIIAFSLALNFDIITMFISLITLILSIIYPFLKRFFYLPQLILGIIFSCPILITFTATNHPLNNTAYLLFTANTLWVIAYDTEYAMVDRHDDHDIELKSSALLFGNLDIFIIGILQILTVFIFIIIAWKESLSTLFYLFAVLGTTILFIWQQILIQDRKQQTCFKAFLNNNYVGLLVFIGIFLHFY